MKRVRLFIPAALSALLLLSSCLGDPDTHQDWNSIPAVIATRNGVKVAVTAAYTISASQLNQYDEGQCLKLSFRYDKKTAGDEDAQQYSLVTLLAAPETVSQGRFALMSTDTTRLRPGEFPIDNAIGSYDYRFFSYLEGYMFLASTFTALTDQRNAWEVYCDPEQAPYSQDYTEEQGASAGTRKKRNVYTMYLRAVKQADGSNPVKSDHVQNAYNIKEAIELLNTKEKNTTTNSSYAVNIRYLSKVSADSTVLTWTNPEYAVLFEIPR